MDIPLAEKARPTQLEFVLGHNDLTGGHGLIAKLYKEKIITSLILWGPPGSGKTTIARILAQQSDADFIELSAVTAGIADVRKVIERAEANARLQTKTVLFIDEIHRFNKAQQDAFLPHMESGIITLIGATTENPSFEVITPLLSRTRVVVLQKLKSDDIVQILSNALKTYYNKKITTQLLKLIAQLSDGDARRALNILELSIKLSPKIDEKVIHEAAQKPLLSYDKSGELHYDLISAFIKILRGSDGDAALYYAARILAGGEDPKFLVRRMIIFASEDIGIANSAALNLAVSTFLAVERIGMPECEYNLFHCIIALAAAKKSRVSTDAMYSAKQAAQQYGNLPVPLHLRNAPTALMKQQGYGKGYDWQANFKHPDGFLPQELKDLRFIVIDPE